MPFRAVALLLTLVAGCGGGGQPPIAAEPVADGAALTVRDSEYGRTITDDRGQALYLFDADTTSESTCYEVCATAWPPLLTDGPPTVGADLDPALVGTTVRTDGTTQVTYNGHPLYYYRGDSPGVIRCQNVDIHGGLWLIVKPDGTPNLADSPV
jgi:predicted lipoprotein with Yx(FWY)xxD motif